MAFYRWRAVITMAVLLNHLCIVDLLNAGSAGLDLISAPCTSGPLGMENGAVPDKSITASTYYSKNYLPIEARPVEGNNGWVPTRAEDQWIQVNLGADTEVTGLVIEGLPQSRWSAPQYVSAFLVQYRDVGESSKWRSIVDAEGEPILFRETNAGRRENFTFPAAVIARFVRIVPKLWTHDAYRMKFEVHGCRVDDGTIRLVDGDGVLSGRVEIYRRATGAWGAVCDAGWHLDNANVVCRQLGFPRARKAKSGSEFGRGTRPITMTQVLCDGTEARLADCPFLFTKYQNCRGSSVAGVVCRPKFNTVRLVGGTSNSNGRVEVYRDGVWGTICDTNWSTMDGLVVCRQLDFSGWPIVVKRGAYYGQGTGPVHISGVTCSGTEYDINKCPSVCWETKCNHTQDAGVECR